MSSKEKEDKDIEGLYIYGSGEMDQLSPIKEDSKNEEVQSKRIQKMKTYLTLKYP